MQRGFRYITSISRHLLITKLQAAIYGDPKPHTYSVGVVEVPNVIFVHICTDQLMSDGETRNAIKVFNEE